MAKKVTIADISKAAGVSTATVSYYLNGRYGNMSEEVRQRLERIVREMDYRPNNLARGLRSKDTKSIGIVIPGLYGQIAFRVVAGACKILGEAGYTVSMMISGENIRKERNYVEQCLANQVRGVIVVPATTNGKTNLGYLQEVHENGVPVVLTTRCPETWPYDGVRLNYRQSVDDMVQHLFLQGYKRAALFLDAADSPHVPFTKELRRSAFLESTRRCFGIEDSSLVWFGIQSEADAERAIMEFLHRYPERPLSVFAVNSPTLGYTLQAARSCGVSIPDELGLCGYGGWDWSLYTEPTLTTITQPLDQVGEVAAKLLLRRLQEPSAGPKLCLLDSRLIPGGSTRPALRK